MIIYPAMDLMDRRPVRLQQGRFDAVTAYSVEPADALSRFADAGAEWAHVVDLDAARAGQPVQHDLIARLAPSSPLKLQVAGGFREAGQLECMFASGIERVVIGSLAIREPHKVRGWIKAFGAERIAISLDIKLVGRSPTVQISGWTQSTGVTLWEAAALVPEARHLLITDIGRDGMLKGPNAALYEEIGSRLPDAQVQASGGISSLTDLEQLPTAGAIIGRALWEGRISLEEAVGLARA